MPIENPSDPNFERLDQPDPVSVVPVPILVTVQTLMVHATAFTPREADEAERAAAELEWEGGSA